MAAVDKIEDQRKPEDFIGHRNRTPVLLSAKEENYLFINLTAVPYAITSAAPCITAEDA